MTVEEGSLRFHIANLRRALGDGKDGARYIATLAGRGYCFVAPIARANDQSDDRSELASVSRANLPNRLTRMVGRAEEIPSLAAQLTATRFVTVVGMRGVGKTTVAIAVGHDLIEAFTGAVHFVDLGAVSDPAWRRPRSPQCSGCRSNPANVVLPPCTLERLFSHFLWGPGITPGVLPEPPNNLV